MFCISFKTPAFDTATCTLSHCFQGWETNPDQEPNEACSAYTTFLLDTAVHEVNILRLFRSRVQQQVIMPLEGRITCPVKGISLCLDTFLGGSKHGFLLQRFRNYRSLCKFGIVLLQLEGQLKLACQPLGHFTASST